MSSKHAILIVNYKTLELTRRCLELIRQNLDMNHYDVWVVDNDSNDESTTYLRGVDWIHLLERKADKVEKGYESHGQALDLAFRQIQSRYVFLFHTDTLVYDASILDMMLEKMRADDKVVAVGCYEQVLRSRLATAWRRFSRFIKHYRRVVIISLGIPSRPARGYYETYIKSFCALWDAGKVREHGFSFYMADRIPSYELQDRMLALGYRIVGIKPRTMFKYLDHVEAGTVTVKLDLPKNHRRMKRKKNFLSTGSGAQ